jgi:ligand-binding sensor domain-containing protein/signal transduction histidine kinase
VPQTSSPTPRLSAGQHLRFENISTEQGLSQSTVTAILQDSQGFMWFGTEGGLNKYDGYQFSVYEHDLDNPQSLSDDSVRAIYEDRDGTLWIGTTVGLDRLDRSTDTFVHHQQALAGSDIPTGIWVSVIHQDLLGTLWVGTEGSGLIALDLRTDQFTVYKHSSDDPKTLSDNTIHSVYEDREGVLWIGTDRGLDRLDPMSGTFVHGLQDPSGLHTVRDMPVYAINEDNQGALWIGTHEGLYQWNRTEDQVTEYRHDPSVPDSISVDSIRCIFSDSQGMIWIGTRSGLSQFDRTQKRLISYRHDPNDPQSLISDSIRSVYEDGSGVIWIGTAAGGLSKYAPATQKFALYQHNPGLSNSLSDDNIWSIYEDHSGILWIGTFSAGLNKLDRQSGTITVYQHNPAESASLSNNAIRTIMEDRNGSLWVGTEYGGLNRFDPETETFSQYRHDAADPGSLSSDRVFTAYEDHLGRLWIGTQGGGLNLLDQDTGTFTHYQHDANEPFSLSNNDVRAIYEDHTGVLWIGTLGGVNLFDDDTKRFTVFRHDPGNPSSLSTDLVASVFEDSEGTIWVGTFGGGLNRFDRITESFARYTEKDGLPDNTVYGILEGSDGALWLSTNKGLSKFDPRREPFRNYDVSDGLQGNQFNPGSSFQSSTGEMFFGGTQGFNAFFPESVTENPVPPPLVITAFKIFNQTIQTDLASNEAIQLSYRDSFISFEFSALDYNAPEKNQYAYRLDGFDKDWVVAGTRHYAIYTNLPGGNYVFRVKGSNNDDVWNETGTQVGITVVPPFWQTWWFLGGIVLILVGAVIGSYRLRVRNVEARSRKLESQVDSRTKELAALNTVAAVASRSLDLQRVLTNALDKTLEVLDVEAGGIYLLQAETQVLTIAAHEGMGASFVAGIDELRVGEGFSGQVVQTGEPLVVRDLSSDPRLTRPAVTESGFHSLAIAPLVSRGEVLGSLFVMTRGRREFSQQEVELLTSIGDQVGVAVENARLYEQVGQVAVVEERQRLARELHDSITQLLHSSALLAEAGQRLAGVGDLERTRNYLAQLSTISQQALKEMRLLVYELRPLALREVGLVGAVQQRLEAVERRAGMEARLVVDVDARPAEGELELPPAVEEELYRIAEEALNNALKHAEPTSIVVTIRAEGDPPEQQVELEVVDDGRGFDPDATSEAGGLGLVSMAQRTDKLDGQLTIHSVPGEGTTVRVSVSVGDRGSL